MNKTLKNAFRNAAIVRPGSVRPNLSDMVQQALALHQQSRFGEAATIYGKVLEADPEHFDALHLLGVAALQTGNPAGALNLMDKALNIKPDSSDLLSNRSSVLMSLGRYEEALECCLKSARLDPKNADAYFNAGNAQAKLGQRTEAIESYRQALTIRPGFVACLTNLGGELIDEGLLTEAEDILRMAAEIEPGHGKAWVNLGVLQQETGNQAGAFDAYQRALETNPGYALARVNLSNLALDSGKWAEAAAQAAAAVELEPEFPEAHNALGNCYRASGQPDLAVQEFRRALELDPSAHGFHSNLLLAMLGDPSCSSTDILDEALRYGARHAGWKSAPHRPSRPLKRIGFVSGDLRAHPVGYFLEPLLANLEGIEVVLYANQTGKDQHSHRLESLATAWRETKRMSSQQLFDQIVADEIDVLIDLSGHTADGRLDVFALRPAPVQATWLGYSGTTGLSQFDALIGDKTVTPMAQEDAYSEPIVRLPHSFAPLFEINAFPDVSPSPCRALGHVTFGCFNATTKVHKGVVELWARVLDAVPGSRLLLKSLYLSDPTLGSHYLAMFEREGIDPERIEILGQVSREEHFAAFSRVDIALDTFPYTGATTTVDNLVMGVPVVTLLGSTYAGRMSASFLSSAGLPGLVAETAEDYVRIATELAQDTEALAVTRASLRDRLLVSPLGDHAGFAAAFLSSIESLWDQAREQAA